MFMPSIRRLWFTAVLFSAAWVAVHVCIAQDNAPPHLVQQDGRHALIVDRAPFLVLGAQMNNSSAWPAMLPQVWPVMEYMHVNTVEAPIYWEQFEPRPGEYDSTNIDALLAGAREHNLRLVLLWFATWKNGSNHYMPQWMKLEPEKYPNMVGSEGQPIDSPSPHAQATLEADKRAFSALMEYLKRADHQHTVIMVQVQNEPGAWGTIRDHSPVADELFHSPVPAVALEAMGKPTEPNEDWASVFGRDADEYFHVWHVAKFIGEVAVAGKDVYSLPMMVNGSVRDPLASAHPPNYQVGGPNDNVFALWRAAAPAIDILAPDIYKPETEKYVKLLDLYSRPDNPLMVPETIGQGPITRFLYSALGRGAIGYAPFGMDLTRAFRTPEGPDADLDATFGDTATNYRALAPMARELARLNYEGCLQAAAEGEADPEPDKLAAAPASQGASRPTERLLHFDNWSAAISYGRFARMNAGPDMDEELGRVLVAQLEEHEFLVTGMHCRVGFYPTGDKAGRPWHYLAVEEGEFVDGTFQPRRILNGDQTDWGLIFTSVPSVLRVTLYTR